MNPKTQILKKNMNSETNKNLINNAARMYSNRLKQCTQAYTDGEPQTRDRLKGFLKPHSSAQTATRRMMVSVLRSKSNYPNASLKTKSL